MTILAPQLHFGPPQLLGPPPPAPRLAAMAFGQEGVRSYRMVSSDKAPMIPYAAATDTVPYARSTLYPAPEATRGGGRPQQGRQMLCIVCCCCLVLVALGLSISALHLVSSPPPFDCKAALGNAQGGVSPKGLYRRSVRGAAQQEARGMGPEGVCAWSSRASGCAGRAEGARTSL